MSMLLVCFLVAHDGTFLDKPSCERIKPVQTELCDDITREVVKHPAVLSAWCEEWENSKK